LYILSHAPNLLTYFRRGEHFRQAQNKRRSKTHLTTSSLTQHNTPSLPFSLLNLNNADEGTSTPNDGPPSKSDDNDRSSRTWRTKALSLIHNPYHPSDKPPIAVVPSLSEVCFRLLLRSFTDPEDFANELAPALPPHLRRGIVRYTAIHQPLSGRKLYSLFDPVGHADGEITVVGPQASFRDDIIPCYRFQNVDEAALSRVDIGRDQVNDDDDVDDDKLWDADDLDYQTDDSSVRLHTLALVSTGLSLQTYLNLPPTLTNLALVDIPTPLPVHRLPGFCPLLVVLDLSFNAWLGSGSTRSTGGTLGRVDWQKWADLRVLGLRQCNVDDAVLKGINHGRWVDVEIIQ